ncbi:MAG: hypothetical protein LBB83_02355 [Treponema sp.]|jgi:hypothetical protein|nr:hypothetical protein [Treponema sp.]
MKRNIRLSLIVYVFFWVCGSLYALGEETLVIGGRAGWGDVVTRQGVAEAAAVRPAPVMALVSGGQTLPVNGSRSPQSPAEGTLPDLNLGFDESRPDLFADRTGHYLVTANSAVSAVSQRRARAGMGAIHFAGSAPENLPAAMNAEPLVIVPLLPQALFAPDRRFGDFTLEFWLNGENMENGEQILFWSSTRLTAGGSHVVQRIQAAVSRNRLRWIFQDFFTDSRDQNRLPLSFNGITPLTPRTWSHHLIRFDSNTGFLEYLVDGQTESAIYATLSGREGGEVFTPVTGQGSRLILGNRFAGMMDEFRLYGSFAGDPPLQKYPRGGGRLETRFLDLGDGNNEILRIEARGGRVSYPAGKTTDGRERAITAVPAGDRAFSFPDDSAIRFFARTSETPFPRTDGSRTSGSMNPGETAWIPFEPGTELKNVRGRYLQLAAKFYPSGNGETTPYLEDMRIVYIPDNPPRPPSIITALPRNGAVELSWNNSADRDTEGYLIYYGTSRGDFFGEDAILGVSPIDVGRRNSVRIEGLSNGVLYYFAVSAYDKKNPLHVGEFSREVSARPLRMVE